MENEVLVVILEADLSMAQVSDIMSQIRKVDGVVLAKTFERIVEDGLPIPEES